MDREAVMAEFTRLAQALQAANDPIDRRAVMTEFARLALTLQEKDDPRDRQVVVDAIHALIQQAQAERERRQAAGEMAPGNSEAWEVSRQRYQEARERLVREPDEAAEPRLVMEPYEVAGEDPCLSAPRHLGKDILFRLKHLGSDLTKPHSIDFYLFFPLRHAAEEAAGDLLAQNFTVRVDRSAKGGQWLCLATHRSVPDQRVLDEWGGWFEQVAAAHGGKYDGWESTIER